MFVLEFFYLKGVWKGLKVIKKEVCKQDTVFFDSLMISLNQKVLPTHHVHKLQEFVLFRNHI